ncbi:MAG: glucose dehydrogenase [Acidobacteria bacterium RIFCSPLOWO2_12_FULL_67_14]|nr:MAG: glucose dehydrogenase [Acidobacteria bacterium RIFCSPLOWO2_12_FULL_67_14]
MRLLIVLAALLGSACTGTVQDDVAAQQGAGVDPRPPNGLGQRPAFAGQTDAPAQPAGVAFDVLTVAAGLEHPWGMDFLPDGRILVTERAGRLRVVSPGGTLSPPVEGLPDVDEGGQGGLLDVALHPGFESNRLIYWNFSEAQGRANGTSVARGRFVDEAAPRVDGVEVIFRQSPTLNSSLHFGSRLVWARDGTLFITMGDRSITAGRMQAQRMDGLIGKIARVNADGSVPTDNPFVSQAGARLEIWSIGHRNVQAAALHPDTGELWEVEHGTRGGDELNIARAGKDYGWPTIAYGIEYSGAPITGGITQQPGMEQPIYYWDPVIAPSGMAFYTGSLFPAWRGSLFIGGLATEDLVRLSLEDERVTGEERLLRDLSERIRDVVQGPDEALYVLTDSPRGRVLKLVPR